MEGIDIQPTNHTHMIYEANLVKRCMQKTRQEKAMDESMHKNNTKAPQDEDEEEYVGRN